MTFKPFKTLLAAVLMLGSLQAMAFKDIKIDLTNANLLTEEEAAGASIVCPVAIQDDGTPVRVENEADANIVLRGEFHSNEHGWQHFNCTVDVEGPVTISMGSCNWGGNVTVKNSANETVGEFNTSSIKACYHGDKENNIVSTTYKGEATTLTIAGGSYTPYIAVEALTEVIDDVNITFAAGSVDAQGTLPAAFTAEPGSAVKLPVNRYLYAEGMTLSGWNDGTTTYAPGAEMVVPNADVTLTPVFVTNSVSLADRTDAATVLFDFQRKNGAAPMQVEGRPGMLVTQVEVNGTTIDVKADFTTSPGKFANLNWDDWAQINNGTTFTIPSCKGAVVSVNAMGEISTLTVDGQNDYTPGNTISYTVMSTAETVDVVFGNGSYFRYLQVVLPYVAPVTPGGTVFNNEPAEIVWDLNSAAYENPSKVAPAEGFSVTSFDCGTMTYSKTGVRQAEPLLDGVTFALFKCTGNSGTDKITAFIKPAAGLTFTPTNITVYIQRFGTDAAHTVVLTATTADGTQTLGTYTAPRNNHSAVDKDKFRNEADFTQQINLTLTAEQQAALASAEGISISLTGGLANTKEIGFSDLHISGVLNGSLATVEKYTVTAAAYPEAAATVSLYPSAETYDEGTEVKVSAIKNFGYSFINWTDADNNVVSTEPVFNLTVDKAYDLTANFLELNTYELNYGVEGGANLYMVTPTPAPTVVDGRNMYEEGTTVTLTASSNPILTFTFWSDGQTQGEISVKMDKDVTLTANYTALDYIAGWDFYLAGANGRAADFFAENNDAVSLTLRDADGNLSGWLDKSQMAAGGYEGRPGAVNWRTTGLGKYYWQTKVDASAFTNIRIITAMLYNYNAYQTYNIEYSLDGEDWRFVGAIEMEGAKKWADVEYTFPAAANNASSLYIRMIADTDSSIDGTTSDNDGNCLGATYILGTAQLVDDGTAPVLLSTVPAEGAKNASANGKIVLNFDEKVKVAEGTTADLSGRTLTPTVAGKVVTFEYKGLEYNKSYTFTLPAGKVMDLTDNAINTPITIHFTTKVRPTVEKALYDFIVPDDGSFKEAIAAANSRANKDVRYRIFVKAGDYLLPVNEGSTVNGYADSRTDLSASNVSIIGEDISSTLITNDCPEPLASNGAYPCEGLRNVYTLRNLGSGTYIQDLSLINGMPDNSGRGEAYEESGDKTILMNVGLFGYQDTYYSTNSAGRYYMEGGVLRGRTDYICGGGDVYYNGIEFRNCGSGYISAPSGPRKYGYIMRDCRITADAGMEKTLDGQFSLGRPWGKGSPINLWINTICEIKPSAAGWSEMSGGFPARFAEYNTVTASGTPVDLGSRKKTFADTHSNNPILTAEEADFYTVANVLGGDDDWDPTEATEQASAPTGVKFNEFGEMTWDDNAYVLLWAVCRNGKVIDFTTTPSYTLPDQTALYTVRAANEMGGLGDASNNATMVDAALINANAEVIESVTYDVMGRRVDSTARGAVIRVDRLSDGTTVTTKNFQ